MNSVKGGECGCNPKYMQAIKTYRNLELYKQAFKYSMDVLEMTSHLSDPATFSVRDRMRDAAQMINIKIAEGWLRRKRDNALASHLAEAKTALIELNLWVMVGYEYNYLTEDMYKYHLKSIENISQGIQNLSLRWTVLN